MVTMLPKLGPELSMTPDWPSSLIYYCGRYLDIEYRLLCTLESNTRR